MAAFAVRNVDAAGSPSDFVGTFHSLWLFGLGIGRSHKLCDYPGVASAAWSNNDFLVVTQYGGKRTSRALVFFPFQPAIRSCSIRLGYPTPWAVTTAL
jgi:hypothetical protein